VCNCNSCAVYRLERERLCPASQLDEIIGSDLLLLVLFVFLVIWLQARLQPNIGFTPERAVMVFTCSDITPPKVNRLG